ncbi:hypothetical protein SAMN05660209_02394 [Geodermatophilus africanus]|uniref:Uncharacterized protein n=1 Tax=Geodermatophilus africanus TaxID=1137993 RepID=A0A1H3I602_9ACTN|nr:hypothetical protein SAMN05660209_02394 [Geodermatophilus africanus]
MISWVGGHPRPLRRTDERPRTRTAPLARRRDRLALAVPLLALAPPAQAASSKACAGGGYRLVDAATQRVLARDTDREAVTTVRAADLGDRVLVQGRYNQYVVRTGDFALFDYAFTGAPNRLDMTGRRFTPVFASKVPDHRGLTLGGDLTVTLEEEDLVVSRAGTGLSMRIQSKDCAQGGIFQMEPERGDGTRTRIVHTLATGAGAVTPFYFDNPHFRARAGQFLGSACTSVETGPPSRCCVQVSPRVTIGNDASPRFVARDSAQVAERVDQPDCGAQVAPDVDHCGRVSVWDVASGGRMGFVTGEYAVEVANPPTECVSDCQAQNQVRGRLAVLGHPFPVPAGSRLSPAESTLLLPPLTAP